MNQREKNNQAMVLAAGVGSRMDPLTKGLPKPLAPILGKPVMEHIMSLCKAHGFTEQCANIHVMAEKMKEHFQDSKERLGVTLNLFHETELTGVAGGIRSCRKYLTNDVVLILMGDALCDADLSALYEAHINSNCPVTIGIMEIEDTSQFGVVVTDENNIVTSFQEKPSAEEAKSNLANTGIYLFDQKILEDMPSADEKPFYDVAKDLFPTLMKKNIPMQAIKINGYWRDIGTLRQYQESIGDVLNGTVKVDIAAEKTNYGYKEDSASVDDSVTIDGNAYIGRNVKIGKNVTLKGIVSIEENSVIEDNAYISNSVIWENSTVRKNAKVISSILGNNCKVSEGIELIANSAWAPNSQIDADSKPAKTF